MLDVNAADSLVGGRTRVERRIYCGRARPDEARAVRRICIWQDAADCDEPIREAGRSDEARGGPHDPSLPHPRSAIPRRYLLHAVERRGRGSRRRVARDRQPDGDGQSHRNSRRPDELPRHSVHRLISRQTVSGSDDFHPCRRNGGRRARHVQRCGPGAGSVWKAEPLAEDISISAYAEFGLTVLRIITPAFVQAATF